MVHWDVNPALTVSLDGFDLPEFLLRGLVDFDGEYSSFKMK